MKKTEYIIEELKQKGLRLTRVRRAFAQILATSAVPISAAEILSQLAAYKIRVNKTTVYRELERLEKIGLVVSPLIKDRKRYFELSSTSHHHHLVCTQCEKVEDIDLDEKEILKEEVKARKERKFIVMRHSLEFFGLCEHCQSIA